VTWGDEEELGIRKLWWTSFYIGCLENKDEVCRFDAKPRFCIIDVIGRHGISKEDMLYISAVMITSNECCLPGQYLSSMSVSVLSTSRPAGQASGFGRVGHGRPEAGWVQYVPN
jgi:hypothetical protein